MLLALKLFEIDYLFIDLFDLLKVASSPLSAVNYLFMFYNWFYKSWTFGNFYFIDFISCFKSSIVLSFKLFDV